MSDSLSAIDADVELYEILCEKFNEKPHLVYTKIGLVVNPYDGHFDELRKKNLETMKKEQHNERKRY